MILGLDIGGANLKAAHTEGTARLEPFALWKQPGELPSRLQSLVSSMPPWRMLAVTMTGELCDCFATKRDGVRAILDAVRGLAAEDRVRVWTNHGRLVDWASAWHDPYAVASANWRALAEFAASLAPRGPGLVLDIGSTTTDIIPFENGVAKPRGLTDPERLRAGELVYLGVKRTPLCALLGVGHAAEFFATTGDILLILDLAAVAPETCDTADGRPMTRAAAEARLARMLCADRETCPQGELLALAGRVLVKMVDAIRRAVSRVVDGSKPPATVVLSGSGEFFAKRFLGDLCPYPQARMLSLEDQLGPAISECICAYAVARLCQTRTEP